jgi:bifunctional non-homologous end joining protein LigD
MLLKARGISHRLHYVAHLASSAQSVYSSACEMGLEGIVSKQLDAPYRSGRSGSWLKTKCRAGQEVVIGGWTTETGAVRSLLAGVYRGNKLVYVGRIGTGYGREVAKSLLPYVKRGAQPHEQQAIQRKKARSPIDIDRRQGPGDRPGGDDFKTR